MSYVWMDEIERVDSIGSGGRTVSPAAPVDAGDSMTDNGRDVHAAPKTLKIPNPELAENGQVIADDNGSYVLGEGGSGSGSAGGSILLVGCTYDEDTGATTLAKTWQEIYDADYAVLVEELSDPGEATIRSYYKLLSVGSSGPDDYRVVFSTSPPRTFTCSSPTTYPTYTEEDEGDYN